MAGSKLVKSSPNVRKYLGFCLLPQAAAIGLAFCPQRPWAGALWNNHPARNRHRDDCQRILGPLGVRYALTKSGEAKALEHNTYESGANRQSQVIASLTESKDNTLKDQS